MLRTLIKKQFLELKAFYFQSKKPGKRRSKRGMLAFAILFSLALLAIAFGFFGLSMLMVETLLPVRMDWLFFSMMGILSVALGAFGSVFSTYAALYRAKDNELLLSMPIPPRQILAARMIGVSLTSLLFSALVWVPAVAAYWTHAPFSAAGLIFSILLTFVLAAFVTVLTCALGWIVALISVRLKNKSFITVLLTLVFLGAYYTVYFRFKSLLQSLAAHGAQVSAAMRTWFYPFYQVGRAALGEVLPMLIFTAITAALSALCIFVLVRSFLRIVTSNRGDRKNVYREQAAKRSDMGTALLRKEFRRFLASPTYMLNCGLGLILLPALAVYALIKAQDLRGLLEAARLMTPLADRLLPALAAAAVCLMLSMNCVAAPSVSLEGRNLWILQALPVPAKQALRAKLMLHVLLNALPAAICVLLLGAALQIRAVDLLLMLLLALVYVGFTAAAGLALNLLRPNLTWTSETVPIKQSASVVIAIFGGWFISILIGGGAILLRALPAPAYLLLAAALLAAAALLLLRWIDRKGAEIFETL